MIKSLFKSLKKEHNIFDFPDKLIVKSNVPSPKNLDICDLIKVILWKIYNISECTINVIENSKILKKFSTEAIEISAVLEKLPIKHTYTLHLSNKLNDSIENIICHEMVHLKQYEDGDLAITSDNRFIWRGEVFERIPYWDRPWEKEAKKEMINIWKQFKEIYYK